MSYRVQLQQFEGPLDLLLYFIRRDELDVYDIPVARITDEYLAYVRLMEEVDLDGVAEFIYMAAILIGIKAKMLLPRPEVDEEGEPIDPRAELVRRLLEYMRYKEAATALATRHAERAERFVRGAASAPEPEEEEPSYRLSVFDLISALKRVLDEAPDEVIHPVRRYEYTVEDQQAYLLTRVQAGERVAFTEIVVGRPRGFIVTTFLAVLDLVQRRVLRIVEGLTPDDFRLAREEQPAVHPTLADAVREHEPEARPKPLKAADRPAAHPVAEEAADG